MNKEKVFFLFICTTLLIFFSYNQLLFADTLTELQQKIQDRTKAIQKLEAETKAIQSDLNKTTNVTRTLKSAISELNLTKKKLDTDLSITQQKITTTELTLEQLGQEIDQAKEKIDLQKKALIIHLQALQRNNDQSLVEAVLSSQSISSFFNEANIRIELQKKVQDNMAEIASTTRFLEDKQNEINTRKNDLVNLQTQLSSKQQAIVATKKEASNLLTITKNKESNYQALLAQKLAERDAFEKELFQFESALKLKIDPNSFPGARSGVLSWPIDRVVITQRFGKTVAAKQLYVSGTHNGVDFGAPIGTPIKAALSGVVEGVGNTDIYPNCYSYGKWIYIKHPDGLSTLYGHLSVQNVQVGDAVTTGQVIGYSGNTGYSTGPHLHFTVYASQGVEIQKYSSSIGCKQATIPIADVKAYLDPLAYLPSL